MSAIGSKEAEKEAEFDEFRIDCTGLAESHNTPLMQLRAQAETEVDLVPGGGHEYRVLDPSQTFITLSLLEKLLEEEVVKGFC